MSSVIALVVLPFMGFIAPFVLCDVLRNNSKKKQLYDEYAKHGLLVPGAILRIETTIHRSTWGYERSRTHKVTFAYRPPGGGSLDEVCIKSDVDWGDKELPASRRVEVLVLPDYPHSGCLKSIIDGRNQKFHPCKTILAVLFLFLIHVLGIAVLFTLIFWCDDGNNQCDVDSTITVATVITSTTLLVVSYFCANSLVKSWKNNMLHGSVPIHRTRNGSYQPLSSSSEEEDDIAPMAEVLAVLDETSGPEVVDDLERGESYVAAAAPTAVVATAVLPTVQAIGTSTDHNNSSTPIMVAKALAVAPHESGLAFYEPWKKDERSQHLRDAVHQENWMFLCETFQELRGKNIERSFYIGVLAKILEESWNKQLTETASTTTKKKETVFSPVLDAWAHAQPNNPDCCLVCGRCYIAYAWHVRGCGNANTVISAYMWPTFSACIDQASMELSHVLEQLDSKDALAYAYSVTVARARKGFRPEAEVQKLMAGLSESNDPSNLCAHESLLQFFCEKWGGSDAEMFTFARKATEALQEGHPLWILLIQAHYEIYLSMASVAQQIGSPVLVAAVANYWMRQEVRQDVLHSYQQYIGSTKCSPTTSVAEESQMVEARNWFAFCLMRTGYINLAHRELLAIGANPTERPWNSLESYQAACNEAGVHL